MSNAAAVSVRLGLWRTATDHSAEVAVVGARQAVDVARPAGAGSAVAPRRLEDVDRFTLRAAQRGDRAAFDRIVDIYSDRLRLLAFHLLHDPDLTDDALQDVFINAYRGLGGFGGRSSLGTWLYRITYTTCLGYLRRRRPTLVSLEEAEDAPDDACDGVGRCDLRDQLGAALARLSPEQRAIVILVDGDGFDYRSVSRVLGVPKGTVCSRLNAARSVLRSALAEQGLRPCVATPTPGPPPGGQRQEHGDEGRA